MSANRDLVRAIIARLHPETGPSDRLAALGEGFGAIVLASLDGLVIRIPKTPDAARRMHVTDHVLRRIAGRLPVPVPVPVWLQERVTGLPFGAMAYPMLAGVPLAVEAASPAIADQVAGLLAALHGIDPVTLDMDLSRLPGRSATNAERVAAMDVCLGWLRRRLPANQVACLEWW